ncbi:MAG: hypothetical protein WB643_07720 [Candidatus Bathyarchaeia archaeon]
MQAPSANILFGKFSKSLLNEDRLAFRNDSGTISIPARQLVVDIDTSRNRIESAGVEVSFERIKSFKDAVKVLFSSERVKVFSAAWGSREGEEVLGEPIIPKLIAREFYNEHEKTLKPSLGHPATILFMLRGYQTAFLTDPETTPVQLGRVYVMNVMLSGENLSISPRIMRLVDLQDWNHVDVNRFSLFNIVKKRKRFN